MAYTGIFCTEAEMQFKAGENRDATGDTEANHNQIAAEVESHINVLCRYNFSDNYASLNTDIRAILKEAASNLGAVYLIQYNMSGYTSRVEAEDMINILMKRFYDCIELLKDQKSVTYITSGTTPAVGGDSITTDEVTITKSAGGVISIKGATGAANNALGVVVLSALTKLPAVDGSLLTNITPTIKIGKFTRDLTTAAGDVAYTGVGFTPRVIIFFATLETALGAFSAGIDDGTANRNAIGAHYYDGYYGATTRCLSRLGNASGNYQQALVKSMDADGFTLTWDKQNTPSGTATVAYLAIK